MIDSFRENGVGACQKRFYQESIRFTDTARSRETDGIMFRKSSRSDPRVVEVDKKRVAPSVVRRLLRVRASLF
jgi:hypothetical protein